MLDSADLAEQTADLTSSEFQAYILLLAWSNENGVDDDGWLHIAESRLSVVAPNRRKSNSISARTVRSMCSKMARRGLEEGAKGAWEVRERGAKWSIRVEKPEQNQASEGHTKKKEYTKKKEDVSDPSDPRPAGAEPPSKPPAVRGKPPTPTERAREQWPALVAAARKHGAVWSDQPGKAQLRTIAARVADGSSEADLEAAIHGAMSLWGDAKDDWDPIKYLRVSTIFAPTKFTEYVQAARNGRAQSGVEVELEKIRAARQREANREATA